MIVPIGADASKLDAKILEHFAADSLKLPRGEWLVKFMGTTQELSTLLTITGTPNSEVGNAVVIAVGSYFGFAPTNVWEWIKSRWA
ncbi:hypothetical protein [Paraburkholderia bannensis]|uniref:hypothetical protein n=1 Tax=Paraburkholderia bannensis TaxID=765414 RepID=UPI002ABE7793|nr:hypothetical protein [Paraburkholderia bannensis]